MKKIGTAVITDCKSCKEFYDEDAGLAACTHPRMQHNEGNEGTIECADCPIFNERHTAFMKKLGTKVQFNPTLWVSDSVVLDDADTLSDFTVGLWQACSIYMERSTLTTRDRIVLNFTTEDFLSEYADAYEEGTEGSWMEWDLAFGALWGLIDGGRMLTEEQFEAYLFEYTPIVCLSIPTKLFKDMALNTTILPPSDRIAGGHYYG